MTWFELATIAAVAGWNLVTYWALWVAVTPGLTWPQAMVVAQSGTAVTNTVPGGSGIGVGLTYAMLESWGFSRGRSTLAVLITGCGTTSSSSACRCWRWRCWPCRAMPAARG
jgi:putative heme transporter